MALLLAPSPVYSIPTQAQPSSVQRHQAVRGFHSCLPAWAALGCGKSAEVKPGSPTRAVGPVVLSLHFPACLGRVRLPALLCPEEAVSGEEARRCQVATASFLCSALLLLRRFPYSGIYSGSLLPDQIQIFLLGFQDPQHTNLELANFL